MRRPTQLRPFHSRNVVDPDFPLLSLSSDPDYSSSSEQSCDTVIYVGPNGTALSDKELTDNEGPPDFVPIVPVLQKTKTETKLEEVHEEAPSKPERDCLKCNTFAELQERLDCIDGSEETNRFPFEEVPAQYSGEQTTKGLCPVAQPQNLIDPSKEESICECIQSENEVEENNTGTTYKMQQTPPIPSGHITDSATPLSPRSVTGSCALQTGSSQTALSSNLQGSRESLNSCGFVDGKPRSMGSPRLGIASLAKTSEYKPPNSPSQRCKVYTQKGVLPSTTLPLNKDAGSTLESLPQPEIRTPPVGMSPQIMKRSLSNSSSFSSDCILEDQQISDSEDSKKEVVSTTMVTVQQPLELNGEDELVFTLVEELTISGVLDNGRPTSIISFNSDCSVQALASGSRPVSIISSISEDLECYTNSAPVSEVSITQFLPLPKPGTDEKCQEGSSRRSSISSWLSEMSTGSDGEQSCHSFIAQTCYGHGEAMADPPISEFTSTLQNISVMCANNRQNPGMDKVLIQSEMAETVQNNVSPIKSCKISTVGKTTVTISNTSTLGSCENYLPIQTNITVYPCIAVNPLKTQESNESLQGLNLPDKSSYSVENRNVSCKAEAVFDDPWLKREDGIKRENINSTDEGQMPEIANCLTDRDAHRKQNTTDRFSSSSGEAILSPISENLKRIVDGCEMAFTTQSLTRVTDYSLTGSLPRGLERLYRLEEQDVMNDDAEINYLPSLQTSRSTLERRVASPKHCVLNRPKGIPPLPPVRKSSLDHRNRASPLHAASSPSKQSLSSLPSLPDELSGKLSGFSLDTRSNSSSKLFSAKLEQLASRANSLGTSSGSHYECLSLERAGSLSSVSSRMVFSKDSTLPRSGRSLNRNMMSSPTNTSQSAGTSPKCSPSKISAVSKLLLASPKARSLSASATKTLSFSTKSLPQSVGRSSSLPPNGKNMSWSTQSLSRNKGSGLASKLPLRAVNGRISELLQGSAGGRNVHSRGNSDLDERVSHHTEKPIVHTLPSPYSKITPPRKPHRCSSGHGSDNSSVLSGELPPAMGKTALFYHSGGSSGYESMMRDSEATGSGSSAQDSMSENSSSVSGRCRSLKSSKKRSNSGMFAVCQWLKETVNFCFLKMVVCCFTWFSYLSCVLMVSPNSE